MINYDIVKNIEGWCSHDKMTKMSSLILATKPTNIVEIGVFYGKSLICQALSLRKNRRGKVYGIDSWNTADCIEYMTEENAINWWSSLDLDKIYSKCLETVQELKLEPFIHIYKGKSNDCINYIDFEIDILHIDGNHEELSSCQDVLNYVPKIKHGGFLWYNDANWVQSKQAIDLIENRFEMKLIDKAQSDDPNNFCNLYMRI